MTRRLAGRSHLVGERFTIADLALLTPDHVAHEANFETERYEAIAARLERDASEPRAHPHHRWPAKPRNASVRRSSRCC